MKDSWDKLRADYARQIPPSDSEGDVNRFNYMPIQWLRKHWDEIDKPLLNYHKGHVDVLLGNGIEITLHANGTWTLEDTSGG